MSLMVDGLVGLVHETKSYKPFLLTRPHIVDYCLYSIIDSYDEGRQYYC